MKKMFLLFLVFALFSCTQKELVSVEVKNARSSTVALFEGKYTVHFMNKSDLEVDFPITADEIRRVKRAYAKQNIESLESDLLIYVNEPLIMPAYDEIYTLKFSDSTQQVFTIRTDYRANPLDKEKYRQLKIFLETIDNIINSKDEIKNAVKSDVWYI